MPYSSKMNRPSSRAAIERGVAAHWAGRIEEALSCYREALAMAPDDAEAISLAGLAMAQTNQAGQALPLLRRAVELEPNQMGFRLNLAEGLEKAGHADQALSELQQVIAGNPGNAQAWEKCGDISAAMHDMDRAAHAWMRAHSVNPRVVSPALKLSRLEITRGRFDAALGVLESAAVRAPDHPAVFSLRCEAMIARRDWPALQSTAAQWTRSHPASSEAWRVAARAAFELGRHRQACDAFARVLELATPASADLTAFASLCLHALDIDAATAALDKAEALDPHYVAMLSTRALLLMYLGRFDEAEDYCRRCLALDPENSPAFTTLSRLRRGRLSDEELGTVTRMAQREDLHLDRRIPAAFAVAHAHDARDDANSAFTGYAFAHALALERDRLENRRYDRAQIENRTRRLVSLFASPPADTAGAAEAPRPIFIVGMPRSGTTLIESVLCAHSRVFACGERPTMQQVLRAFLALDEAGKTPDRKTLEEWSTVYLSVLPALGGADHVTDKHPLNFAAAGLIARLFPHAVIVHVRRNPIETCLSIYRQEFNKHWTFAHRLSDIGHYYGEYAELVAHWERVLPKRFTTIQYEDFARNFEHAAPDLLKACGLAWEPQCLDFQHSPRAITTFSTVQARDPVTVGNGRAQRYASHLAELVAALEAANVDLETGALRG